MASKPALTPDGYQAVTPWIIARGVPGLIDFLVRVFDAVEVVRPLGPDGIPVMHAEVRIHGAPVMLFDLGADWPTTPAYLRVYVPDCDEVLRRAVAAGSQLVTTPTELLFGDRVSRFADPRDNLRWVHSRVFEPSAEELASGAGTPASANALGYLEKTLQAEMHRRGQATGSNGDAEK